MLSDTLIMLFGFLMLITTLHVASRFIIKSYERKVKSLESKKENL